MAADHSRRPPITLWLESENNADGKRLRRDREHQARRVFKRLHRYFLCETPHLLCGAAYVGKASFHRQFKTVHRGCKDCNRQ